MGDAQQVTTLLDEVRAGHADAQRRLVELIYDELHRIADGQMRLERQEHTLQPTALVNEALVRLIEDGAFHQAPNRAYLFGAATQAMRRVLVDHARRRAAGKRGGDRKRTALDDALAQFDSQKIDILALDEALRELELLNTRQSRIVMLRFFGGLTISQIAEQLTVSVGTVEADFRVARAWLRGRLRENG